jgi:hypothetical protein
MGAVFEKGNIVMIYYARIVSMLLCLLVLQLVSNAQAPVAKTKNPDAR